MISYEIKENKIEIHNKSTENESGNIEKPLRFKMKIVIISKKQTKCRKQKLRKINK